SEPARVLGPHSPATLRSSNSRESQLSVFHVDQDSIALTEAALEDQQRQAVLDQALDGPLQRPGAVDRVPTPFRDQLPGGWGDLELDLSLRQPLLQAGQLDVHDRRQLLPRELPEHGDLVHAVQELRPEVAP